MSGVESPYDPICKHNMLHGINANATSNSRRVSLPAGIRGIMSIGDDLLSDRLVERDLRALYLDDVVATLMVDDFDLGTRNETQVLEMMAYLFVPANFENERPLVIAEECQRHLMSRYSLLYYCKPAHCRYCFHLIFLIFFETQCSWGHYANHDSGGYETVFDQGLR